jgi:hypothetical protein
VCLTPREWLTDSKSQNNLCCNRSRCWDIPNGKRSQLFTGESSTGISCLTELQVNSICWTDIQNSNNYWESCRQSSRRQEEAVKDRVGVHTVGQESLWLWHRNSSGTQEGQYPPLEAGIRRLVRDSRLRGPDVCILNCRLRIGDSTRQ